MFAAHSILVRVAIYGVLLVFLVFHAVKAWDRGLPLNGFDLSNASIDTALVNQGEGVLEELEAAFHKPGSDLKLQKRIVSVLSATGGERAMQLLVDLYLR